MDRLNASHEVSAAIRIYAIKKHLDMVGNQISQLLNYILNGILLKIYLISVRECL